MTTPNSGATAARRVAGLIAQWRRDHADAGAFSGSNAWGDVITAQPDYDAVATEWLDTRDEHNRAFFRDGSAIIYTQDPDKEGWRVDVSGECQNGRRAVRYVDGRWARLLYDDSSETWSPA